MIWDSHPLALGATPSQVFIDGIPQFESAYVARKPANFQRSPKVPNFEKEANETIKYEGLPPLHPKKATYDVVVFTNVKSVFTRSSGVVQREFSARDYSSLGVVVTRNGTMVCAGDQATCLALNILGDANHAVIDLEGGEIVPGLVSFGSPLGLQHIDQEPSTNDGDVPDPLVKSIPKIMGGDTMIVRASDGLEFASRDALYVSLLPCDADR